jgi:hypothetical protein
LGIGNRELGIGHWELGIGNSGLFLTKPIAFSPKILVIYYFQEPKANLPLNTANHSIVILAQIEVKFVSLYRPELCANKAYFLVATAN